MVCCCHSGTSYFCLCIRRSTHSYFTGLSDVYRYYDLFAVEKYVEPFANGVVVYAFHLG